MDEYNVLDASKENADKLGEGLNPGLFGQDTFRSHMQVARRSMLKWGIPHHYVDGRRCVWIPGLVAYLTGEKWHGVLSKQVCRRRRSQFVHAETLQLKGDNHVG